MFAMTAVNVIGVPVGVIVIVPVGVWLKVIERSVAFPAAVPILVTNAWVLLAAGVGGGVNGFSVGKSAEAVEPVMYALPCESRAIEPREASVGPSNVENSKVEPAGPISDTKLRKKHRENEAGSQGPDARMGLEVGKSSETVNPVTQALPLASTAMEPGWSRKVPIEELLDSVDSEETEPPRKVE